MDLEEKYKEETGFDVGKIHEIGTTYYSDDYVKWLEKQLLQTDVSGSTSTNLQIMYGELMQELTTERDYFNKQRIQKKMKAIEVLLKIDFIS
tara:strand:- start:809 stop:1084 length:276 start_codon:yes stop_codon:yes gene_type:complete